MDINKIRKKLAQVFAAYLCSNEMVRCSPRNPTTRREKTLICIRLTRDIPPSDRR